MNRGDSNSNVDMAPSCAGRGSAVGFFSPEPSRCERDVLTYALAHDIRSPLVAISTFSQVLEEQHSKEMSGKGPHYVGRIRAAAALMHQMVDGLLTLAQLAGKKPDRSDLDVTQICQEIGELERAQWSPMSVRYEVQAGMAAKADRGLVHLILSNLVHNAWKFSSKSAQPVISVGWQEEGGRTIFHVKDNGAGFDPAFSGKLFMPFIRLHSVSEFEGTGIGLAVTRKAVELHGGTIWARSSVNAGAEFFFTLGDWRGG